MPSLLYFLIAFLTIIDKTAAVSYYDVTASTGSHLEDVIGCYADTGHTTNLNVWRSKIFKKDCPSRYLLQLESNGNWAIAEDILGKNVILEEEMSSYPRTPDTVSGIWTIKNQRYIPSFKIRSRRAKCLHEECSNRKVNDNVARSETTTDKDGNDMAEDNDEKRSPTVLVYAVCGVLGGIILTLCMVFIAHCVYIKKKEASKEVTVDANPEYGKEYEYDYQHVWDEGISGIVDQNEYYNS